MKYATAGWGRSDMRGFLSFDGQETDCGRIIIKATEISTAQEIKSFTFGTEMVVKMVDGREITLRCGFRTFEERFEKAMEEIATR